MEFHQRLVAERKRLGLTQREFAAACGVRPATQFLYEKGDRSPSAIYLSKALELGANLTALFFTAEQVDTGSLLPLQEVTELYIQCDHLCRDSEGRLLDLEERANTFRKLYAEKMKQLKKMAS